MEFLREVSFTDQHSSTCRVNKYFSKWCILKILKIIQKIIQKNTSEFQVKAVRFIDDTVFTKYVHIPPWRNRHRGIDELVTTNARCQVCRFRKCHRRRRHDPKRRIVPSKVNNATFRSHDELQCGILSHHSHRGPLYRRTIVSRVIACIRGATRQRHKIWKSKRTRSRRGTIRVPVRNKRVTSGPFTKNIFEHLRIRKKRVHSRAESDNN